MRGCALGVTAGGTSGRLGAWALNTVDAEHGSGGNGRAGEWGDPAAVQLLKRACKRRSSGAAVWPTAADVSLQLAAYGAPQLHNHAAQPCALNLS